MIVLEQGRITQIGTHDELMAKDGHYREIAAVQLYGDEPPDARRRRRTWIGCRGLRRRWREIATGMAAPTKREGPMPKGIAIRFASSPHGLKPVPQALAVAEVSSRASDSPKLRRRVESLPS